MKPISRERIEAAWDRICELDEAQSVALANKYMMLQPFLAVYIVANDEMTRSSDDDATLATFGLALLEAAYEQNPNLKQVTDLQIERLESEAEENLVHMEGESEISNKLEAANWLQSYNQKEVFGFALELLMSGYEESPDLVPETTGMQMLCVKTVIDCLDQ